MAYMTKFNILVFPIFRLLDKNFNYKFLIGKEIFVNSY